MLRTPLFLEPRLFSKRWGDGRLLTEAGFDFPVEPQTGEVWLVSDLEGRASPIRGDAEGRHLDALMAEAAEQLLGESARQDRAFPLIIKLLMAGSKLSIQVHPDAENARRLGLSDRGKHEAWWVLGARPEARIYRGMERPCSAAEATRAIAENRFQELLHVHEPQRDEVYDIAPGTFHGCGDGLLLLEVQERCDVTFRVFDWGREGTELHIEEALGVGALTGKDRPAPLSADDCAAGIEAAPFTMACRRLAPGASCAVGASAGVEVLVLVSGMARLHHEAESWPMAPGDTVLWPACIDAGTLSSTPGARWLQALPGSSSLTGSNSGC